MGSGQEVPQADELAMVLIFHVDHSPSVLAPANRPAANDDVVLGADNSKRDEILDGSVHGAFFLILLVVVVRIHA